MSTSPAVALSEEEQFSLIQWLMNRYDSSISSIANRAAVVLSADAILLAGLTFSFDKVGAVAGRAGSLAQAILLTCLGAAVLLLSASIGFATVGIANTWRTSRKIFDEHIPERLFFHARDTLETLKTFPRFEQKFRQTTAQDMANYALADLWTRIHQHHARYQMLRRAIRLLTLTIIPFVISIGLLIVGSY